METYGWGFTAVCTAPVGRAGDVGPGLDGPAEQVGVLRDHRPEHHPGHPGRIHLPDLRPAPRHAVSATGLTADG